jgi:hypothetical protein
VKNNIEVHLSEPLLNATFLITGASFHIAHCCLGLVFVVINVTCGITVWFWRGEIIPKEYNASPVKNHTMSYSNITALTP